MQVKTEKGNNQSVGEFGKWSVSGEQLHTNIAGRQHLRSASQRKLIVPRYHVNNFGVLLLWAR